MPRPATSVLSREKKVVGGGGLKNESKVNFSITP